MGGKINIFKPFTKLAQKLTGWMPNWLKGTLQILNPTFMLANANAFKKLPIANGLFKSVGSMCEQFTSSFLTGNVLPMLGGVASRAASVGKLGDFAEMIAPALENQPRANLDDRDYEAFKRTSYQNTSEIMAWAMAQNLGRAQ